MPTKAQKGVPSKPESPLSKQRYAALLRDVQKLVSQTTSVTDERKVLMHWQLGRRIQDERLDRSSGYHNTILRDLAADARFAVRTLQYAVAFHAAYPTVPKHPLSWLHYRTLLDHCRDASSRAHYTTLALQQQLSARELARLIVTDRGAQTESAALPRPSDPSYLYAAQVEQVIDGDTLDLSIDLGFHTRRFGRFRLAQLDAPELPAPEARAARDFIFARLRGAKTLVVKTQRLDLHGRYVAHLFYAQAELSIARCFSEGTHLNAELIEHGHAERVQ